MNGKDANAKSGVRKYLAVIRDICRRIKETISRLTGKDKADAERAYSEMTQYRDKLEAAMKASAESLKGVLKSDGNNVTIEEGKNNLKGAAARFQRYFTGSVDSVDGIELSRREAALIIHNLKTGYGHIDGNGARGSVNTAAFCYLFDVTKNYGVRITDVISHEDLNIHDERTEREYNGSGRKNIGIDTTFEKSRAGKRGSADSIASSEVSGEKGTNDSMAREQSASDSKRDTRKIGGDSEKQNSGREGADSRADYEGARNRVDDGQHSLKGAEKNTAQTDGGQYSIKTNGEISYFEQQLMDYKSGKLNKNDTLVVGRTPDVFQKIGLEALPMTINQTHVDYALNGTKDYDHYLREEGLKQLPDALKHPVAIISSKTQSGTSLVAMLDVRQNGKQVVVPIVIDGFGTHNGLRIDSNALTSAYGKNYSISKVLKNALENEANGKAFSVYYVNMNKATQLLQGAKVPMPKMPATKKDGFVHSITEPGSPVKRKIVAITETKQFKRWFGKSKVVDGDGKPLVVYHGTDAEFNVFDMTKGRSTMDIQGAFFSPYELDASGYGKNVYACYLSIKTPASGGVAYKALNMFKGQNNAGVKAREYLIKQGYDGVYNGYDEYIAFYPNQIKSATDNIGTFDGSSEDILLSLKGTGDLLAENQALRRDLSEIRANAKKEGLSADELNSRIEERVQEDYEKYIEQYGEIGLGEKPFRNVKVPKKTSEQQWVSQTIRTVMEAGATPDIAIPNLKELVATGEFSYEAFSDKAALSEAEASVKREGWEIALVKWQKDVKAGIVNKSNTAMGWVVYNNAVNAGKTGLAIDILDLMIKHQRTALKGHCKTMATMVQLKKARIA